MKKNLFNFYLHGFSIFEEEISRIKSFVKPDHEDLVLGLEIYKVIPTKTFIKFWQDEAKKESFDRNSKNFNPFEESVIVTKEDNIKTSVFFNFTMKDYLFQMFPFKNLENVTSFYYPTREDRIKIFEVMQVTSNIEFLLCIQNIIKREINCYYSINHNSIENIKKLVTDIFLEMNLTIRSNGYDFDKFNIEDFDTYLFLFSHKYEEKFSMIFYKNLEKEVKNRKNKIKPILKNSDLK